MAKGVKLQLSVHVEGDTQINSKKLYTFMLSKRRIRNISETAKDIKLKLSDYIGQYSRTPYAPKLSNEQIYDI